MIDKPYRRGLLRASLCAVSVVLTLSCAGSDGAGDESVPTDSQIAPQVDTTIATTVPAVSTTTSLTTTMPTTSTTQLAPVVETVADTAVDVSVNSDDSLPEDSLPAPTNTTFDPETVEGEIEQAALANFAAFVRCLEQLPECDLDQLTRFAALNYADGNRELAIGWNDAGYEARDTDDYNYRVDEIEEIADTGVQAVVVTCVWRQTKLVQPGSGSTPEVVVLGGDGGSEIGRYLLDKIGEAWFVTASESVQQSTGAEADLCV